MTIKKTITRNQLIEIIAKFSSFATVEGVTGIFFSINSADGRASMANGNLRGMQEDLKDFAKDQREKIMETHE